MTSNKAPQSHSTRRRFARSPYLWTMVGLAAVVLVAWLGRESYRPVMAGEPAPGFTLTTLDGREVSLADYRDHVVLLNIWATWCPPCLEEMPSMQRLYEALDGENFEILAVSIDAAAGQTDGNGMIGGDLAAFVAQHGLSFPVLKNPSGDIQQTYQTFGVPESFVISKDGVIYKKVANATEWDHPSNEDLIRRLLSQ